jgi:HEAT repeat protein
MNRIEHIQGLISVLREEYSQEAMRELEAQGEAAIGPILGALWRTDIDPYGHDTFAEVLVNILLSTGCEKTVDVLVSLLEHDNADVRRRAIKAMGEAADRRAIPVLRIALYDRNEVVQQTSAHALITLQYGANYLRACRSALYDEERRVRYYAIRQLEQARSVDGLIEGTYVEDGVVRQIAVWSLGRIRSPQSVPALIDALEDHDLEVRGGAVWALGNIGNSRAVAALVPLLDDPEPVIARLASDALHKLGYAPMA